MKDFRKFNRKLEIVESLGGYRLPNICEQQQAVLHIFIHVIEQGDTLYKLGKRYGVTVSALLFANPWVNVYNLQIGDELCIPDFGCRRCKETKGENLDEKRADEMQSLS